MTNARIMRLYHYDYEEKTTPNTAQIWEEMASGKYRTLLGGFQ